MTPFEQSPKPIEHYDIRVLKDGTWLYGGTPIARNNMVRLFASVLKRDAEGRYWLETPHEKGLIDVEDVPFAIVEMKISSSGKNQNLLLRTNLDLWITLGPKHGLRIAQDGQDKVPYVQVRDNIEARVNRAVYYEMAKIAVESDDEKGLFGLWSQNTFYPIGKI